ncbi:MAG: L-seryl-tRNA(Sec) selenium transferase [Planctomycetales bacterium]|nr:L-seryl-tRNA(Sec) selenium transferase [Planctomycetales bacterium]
MAPHVLRKIPSVTELLESKPLRPLVDRVSHNVVVSGVRSFLDELRADLGKSANSGSLPDVSELAEKIARRILQGEQPSLRPAINATGILLHTGLGRAPLSQVALDELQEVAGHYASLELDLATGQRSQRVRAVEGLLCQLTGAEAALVVNNNAGATLLAMSALASGKEVIVSRGELIEIGGSYRLPDVMQASGARLREVGTTNKTRIEDYEQAIDQQTAALMRVHTSNYVIVGFTAAATLNQLVQLGRRHQLPVIDDIGSGAIRDLSEYGMPDEPVAGRSIEAGADLVLFSGDKLLGGPQCGILVGRRALVQQMARHPLTRALRVGKLTLAALGATLRLHRDPALASREVPLLQMLGTSPENLKNRAQRLVPQIAAAPAVGEAQAVEDEAYLGGGSVPNQRLDTWCVALRPAQGSLDRLAAELRTGTPAVVGRIQADWLLLDLRTVMPAQDAQLVEAVLGVR